MLFAIFCFALSALLFAITFAKDIATFTTVAAKSYRDNSHYNYTYITHKASIFTVEGIRQRWNIALDTAGTIRQYYASTKVIATVQKSQLNSPFGQDSFENYLATK